MVSIDGESNVPSKPTDTRLNPCAIVWSEGALWVAQLGSGNVARVDPDSGEAIFTLPVGGQVWDMQVGEDGSVLGSRCATAAPCCAWTPPPTWWQRRSSWTER